VATWTAAAIAVSDSKCNHQSIPDFAGRVAREDDMNKQKWIILTVALGLMGVAAGLLTMLRTNQRLGRPGVRTTPIPGGYRVQVDLPERVLEYTSQAFEPDALTTNTLPQDTSFGRRLYTAPDKSQIDLSVVLMGSDRTSIHKTEYCLEGQGWRINRQLSQETTIHVDRPRPYDLPVMKFIATHAATDRYPALQGVYVCWFVADNDEYTPRHWQRMWWLARDLFRTGVLQRWALVSYFAVCGPGQEEATFEQMKKFIAASVPEFQLVPGSDRAALAAGP
jgi:hypothetical protein